jgi:hypothetical protein
MNNLNSNTRNLLYTAYGIGTTLGSELPHSRLQESEADEIGLIYMARAGYDPEQAIAFWQRFSDYNQKKGSKVPWFLRTHPLDEQRIENLRRFMPKAKLQYRPRLGDVNAPVVVFKKVLPARLKAVMLVDPVNGAAKTISWVPSLTLYSARRKAGFNRVPNVATIERGSKIISGKRGTTLEPGDIVRWK